LIRHILVDAHIALERLDRERSAYLHQACAEAATQFGKQNVLRMMREDNLLRHWRASRTAR